MSGERETKDARALSLREQMGKVDRGEGGCEVSAKGWPGSLGTLVQAVDISLGPSEPRGLPGEAWLRGRGSIYILGLCFQAVSPSRAQGP